MLPRVVLDPLHSTARTLAGVDRILDIILVRSQGKSNVQCSNMKRHFCRKADSG